MDQRPAGWTVPYQSFALGWTGAGHRAPTVVDTDMTTATQSRRRPTMDSATPASSARDRAWAVEAVVAANAVVTIALWLGHGGAGTLDQPGGLYTAVGQLTGLAGTYAILVQLLLMSRIGWLERYIGFDRLAVWHRWNGFASVSLLVAHAVFITLGYAATSDQSIPTQLGDFVQHYPDVLMSIVGLGLFIAIAATSVRAARRRLSREAWYSIHVYAYLAVALSFAHQLAVGQRLRHRSARPSLVDRSVHRRVRRHRGVASRPTDLVQRPPPPPDPSRAPRGRRHRFHLHLRPPSRRRQGRGRTILPVAIRDRNAMGDRPPVLALRPSEQEVPAHHRQGPRRSHSPPAASPARRACSQKARTARSPLNVAPAPRSRSSPAASGSPHCAPWSRRCPPPPATSRCCIERR